MTELTLPRPYRAIVLGSGERDAPARARAMAAEGAGAGTLVWHPDPERLDCAVVLRPEETGEEVLPVVLVAALALSDAIGAVGPPAVALDLVWPGSVRVNGGLVGGIGVDLESEADLRQIPEWAVLAADVRIAAETGIEGGERPDVTSLEAEGFAGVVARALAEAFARYLLVWMDRWQEQGLAPISRHWLHRATARHRDTVLLLGGELIAGTVERLDESGCLRLETGHGPRRLTLESWWRESA
jgi:biotin-(acetyl-CoA carboxylase) ligase